VNSQVCCLEQVASHKTKYERLVFVEYHVSNMQMDKEQPEVLTEEHFVQAAKRTYNCRLSNDEIQVIKKELVGQPVWKQDMSSQELQEGGFESWGEYVACACLKAW